MNGSIIDKIELVKTLKDPSGSGEYLNKGKVFTAPNIPKWMINEARISPKLFKIKYRRMEAPMKTSVADTSNAPISAHKGEYLSMRNPARPGEDEEEFYQEWCRLPKENSIRKEAFHEYILINMARFEAMSKKTKQKAIAKWNRFYPDKPCPIKA